MKLNHEDSLALARMCCRALVEKKAGELKVIDVSELSSITDFIVVATATSEPHVRALRVELEKALDASNTRIVGVDSASESGWTVMDAFDVMVHIFTADTRSRYKLETLWRDGTDVSVDDLLAGKKITKKKTASPRPKAKKRVAAKKKVRK